MNYTIHLSNDFKDLQQFETSLNDRGVTISHNSAAFEVIGDSNMIEEITKSYPGMKVLKHIDRSNIVKPYLHTITKLSENHNTTSYFTPPEVAKIYGVNGTTNDRVNIALIELGGGYKTSDLNTYWEKLGLQIKPNVYSIGVDGASNSPGSEADGEVVLDIEVVGGIVPNSNIYVYFTPNTDKGFYDAINAAMNNSKYPVSVISISWGSPENKWDNDTIIAMDELFQQAVKKGITICVASGDNGSSDGEFFGKHADFPSSSPNVLSCGGTRLICPDKNYTSSTTKETVWGGIMNNKATGGGFSSIFTRPTYQQTILSKFSNDKRGVPDVCGVADPQTGWLIYLNDSYSVIGGTSAVAPFWAAYLASVSSNKFVTAELYSAYQNDNSIMHDVIIGTNGAYRASKGWDPASGLGSLNGNFLTPMLKNITSDL
uniref:Peptidase S53 domain-containing protein n=1 Tax=viral metagenome TaxID=1070528 RepID=A0A6C0LVQ7_9ZZZZ